MIRNDSLDMRGAVIIWTFLFGPIFAVGTAVGLYKLGIVGWDLFAASLVVQAAAVSVGVRGVGLPALRALLVGITAAVLCGALFLLWASVANPGL
jgi:hypothetical protein